MKDLTLIIPTKEEVESLPIFLKEIENIDCKKIIVLQKEDVSTKESISGFKNIKIDTVHTTISTKDSLQQAANILMNIGPRAKMLSGTNVSDETMLQIKSEIEELCKSRQIGNEITYKACLNYVSAVR